ncbi:Cof-type HAD-IIB family hydrolase [Buchnera aphidicola (Muscaphis stroyani)]|uniref:Cof-type HAD-IIB family hydrolase n=1 Tax=Buchnera aphidicola (Muscaphis stroyani) TaxID=1241869 RepID=A0A4D6YE49_9GAMM|nr:Cof-type HAD-IIB family hydrolase [Buchnera aphidicola]QCI24148.1 Cof-type HAD-IIB family hydrolase [Buchnera aphidicola (Muscaphis stroyani)]
MYRIIASDLDGTLLSPENKITKYTQKIIRFLTRKGFYFILASGRHYIDVNEIRNLLNIKSFMITSNGAQVYDLDNKLISCNYLDINVSLELCKLKFLDPDIITQIYSNDQWYVNNTKIENNFCPSLSSLKHQCFDINSLDFRKISKIFFTSHNFQKLRNLESKIIANLHSVVNVNFSMPSCLEVTSKKASKGCGLKLISKILKISLKNFISFGDGMNDQDMLSTCGKACIMKNADPRLKRLLPHLEVIEDNKNNGVAIFLYNMFIKKNTCIF